MGHDGEGTMTMSALNPEDTSILYSYMFPNAEEMPVTVFPTTSDTIDETRPDEVVSFDTNFLVKPHVRPHSVLLPSSNNSTRYQQ